MWDDPDARPAIRISVQADDFDMTKETHQVTKERFDVGAVATFTGLCRGEEGRLSALELEHYPGMAEKQLAALAERAATRWPVDALTILHRYGKLAPGEQIVGIIATSRHRDAAFDAARFIMDYLKTDAPFWKKEHAADGGAGDWVDARESDDAAKARWD
ncbi:MAG: molybdenum cofactor biosynthesis protein MoaE [Pseudomonadota bacterium]